MTREGEADDDVNNVAECAKDKNKSAHSRGDLQHTITFAVSAGWKKVMK